MTTATFPALVETLRSRSAVCHGYGLRTAEEIAELDRLGRIADEIVFDLWLAQGGTPVEILEAAKVEAAR